MIEKVAIYCLEEKELNKFLMRLHRHVNVDFCCRQMFLSNLPRNSDNRDRGPTICLSGERGIWSSRANFHFSRQAASPDDNIDSGGGRGEVGDMKLFCRRFAAAPQKRVKKSEKMWKIMQKYERWVRHLLKYTLPHLCGIG